MTTKRPDDRSPLTRLLPAAGLALALLAPTQDPAAAAPGPDPDTAWPTWRGPLSTGVATRATPPLTWSEQQNIRFKVKVPGQGLASPVVWGDRLFLISAVPADETAYQRSLKAAETKESFPPAVEPVKQRFVVLAYSTRDGRLLWERTAAEKVPQETHHIDGSWASASPVTDGRILVAHFGSNGTFAYDLDGNLLWQTDLGDMQTRNGFGEGSSPALADGKVIINWDHEGDSFIVALDAKTGKEIWKTPRPGEVTSWATPLVMEAGGKAQVIVPATGRSRGYDLATGKEQWSLSGMTVNSIPSPMPRGSLVYLMSGFRGSMLQAVDITRAEGKLEDSPAVVWSHDRDTPYVPSGLLYDGDLYFLKGFKNILSHLDAATGKPVHDPVRIEALHNIYASPVGAADRIYLFDRDGHAAVIAHGKQFKVLAESTLDEGAEASPAVVGDTIYLRAHEHLYAIAPAEGGGEMPAAPTGVSRRDGGQ